MSFDDPFANIEDEPKKGKKKPKKKTDFAQPLDVDKTAVNRATGRGKSIKHGSYVQMTFRIPEEDVESIKEWAKYLGMSQEDVKRYIVNRGLLALEQGEQPEYEVVEVRKLKR